MECGLLPILNIFSPRSQHDIYTIIRIIILKTNVNGEQVFQFT